MSSNDLSESIVLDQTDLEIAQSLKRDLDCNSDAEAVYEALHATRKIVTCLREGGKVVLENKKQPWEQLSIK